MSGLDGNFSWCISLLWWLCLLLSCMVGCYGLLDIVCWWSNGTHAMNVRWFMMMIWYCRLCSMNIVAAIMNVWCRVWFDVWLHDDDIPRLQGLLARSVGQGKVCCWCIIYSCHGELHMACWCIMCIVVMCHTPIV